MPHLTGAQRDNLEGEHQPLSPVRWRTQTGTHVNKPIQRFGESRRTAQITPIGIGEITLPTGPDRRHNGGTARGYLADSPRRQCSIYLGHPWHDSGRSLDIYADRRVPGTRAHAADRAMSSVTLRCPGHPAKMA